MNSSYLSDSTFRRDNLVIILNSCNELNIMMYICLAICCKISTIFGIRQDLPLDQRFRSLLIPSCLLAVA